MARELKRYVGHLPGDWETVRKSLASFDPDTLLATLAAVPETDIAEEWREEWRKYRAYLDRHREHLRDYRKQLRQAGIDTSGMRRMGSAEAQMRIMAKRTKGGGYSWSVRGVQAMFKTIMKWKEGRPLTNRKEDTIQSVPSVKIYDSRMVAGSETRVERVYGRDYPPVVRAHAKQSNGSSLKRIVKRKLKGRARIAKERIKKENGTK